jgi:DNA-binding NarL/FixJ family response regulator
MAYQLTPREQQIVALIVKGYKNKQIATELNIGLQTVKNHASVIFSKLKVRKRSDIVRCGNFAQEGELDGQN